MMTSDESETTAKTANTKPTANAKTKAEAAEAARQRRLLNVSLTLSVGAILLGPAVGFWAGYTTARIPGPQGIEGPQGEQGEPGVSITDALVLQNPLLACPGGTSSTTLTVPTVSFSGAVDTLLPLDVCRVD